ncbi:MAG TPA: DUF2142 domain-containing protein [Solirubrobacteraceae bacterium]|nr:DUF2142 domain-containing protein [Solirubrobacteraceae bacterium]
MSTVERTPATPGAALRCAPLAAAVFALRRIPAAALLCALVACLNAVCWSLITPPFEVVDESDHFAYVQWLSETARLPKSGGDGLPTSINPGFSPEQQVALRDLHQPQIVFHPQRRAISTRAEQHALQADLQAGLSRKGDGNAGSAVSEPPLYYALQAIPYELGSSGSLLDRLQLMRLFSALLAGLTALFAYLFVREVLPGARRTWLVGGLGVALLPSLGFMSGAVNPEALLYAVSAATFYCLARAFRRGLTNRSAAALGVAVAVGTITKLNFLGLLPGVILGLLLLTARAAGWRMPRARVAHQSSQVQQAVGDARSSVAHKRSRGRQVAGDPRSRARRSARGARSHVQPRVRASQLTAEVPLAARRAAYRSLALALAIAGTPATLYVLVNLLSNRSGLGFVSHAIHATSRQQHSLLSEVSFIWQFYLPRLPGMAVDFPGILTTRNIWFNWGVGLYGWLDTVFPPWVYTLALIPAGLIGALLIRALVNARAELRRRAGELFVYFAMSAGVLLIVAASSYVEFPQQGSNYAQPRYLLPMLALLGVALALAARAAGRRWGPAVGALLVIGMLTYDVLSQLLVVARFYGPLG